MLKRNPAVLVLLIVQMFLLAAAAPGQTTPLSTAKTIGVFRNATWIVNAGGNHVYQGGTNDPTYGFGEPGDQPVIGYWNAGTLAIGVFRNGYWYLDWNTNWQWDIGIDDASVPSFGQPGDIPVVGDWNHDGHLRIGVVRNVGGLLVWYVQTGCANGANVCDYDPNYTISFYWGLQGDRPVIGDWDHTGHLRIGLVRGSTWFVNTSICNDAYYCNGNNATTQSFTFSSGSPVAGDWGQHDLGIGSFNGGIWGVVDGNILTQSWNFSQTWSYGMAGDIPVVTPPPPGAASPSISIQTSNSLTVSPDGVQHTVSIPVTTQNFTGQLYAGWIYYYYIDPQGYYHYDYSPGVSLSFSQLAINSSGTVNATLTGPAFAASNVPVGTYVFACSIHTIDGSLSQPFSVNVSVVASSVTGHDISPLKTRFFSR